MKKTSVSKIKQTTGFTDMTTKKSELMKHLRDQDLDDVVIRKGFLLQTVHGLEPHLRKGIAIEIKENIKYYKTIWRLLVFPASNQFPLKSSKLEDKVLSYLSFNNHEKILKQLTNFSLIDDFFKWFYDDKFDYEDLAEIYLKFNECKHQGNTPDSSEKLEEIQKNIDDFFSKIIMAHRASLVYGRTILEFDPQTANAEDQEIIKKQKMRLKKLPKLISDVKYKKRISPPEFMEHCYNLKSLFGGLT